MTDLTGEAPDPSPSSAIRPNPYVGPRAFEFGETIYGRGHEITELRDVLIARRIVLLYSPSGAGKSSLIEAGLRVELAAGGFRLFPTIRVGAEPPADVDAQAIHNRYVLSTVLSLEEGRPTDRQLPHTELATTDLPGYLDQLFEDEVPGSEPCLIFDQFEELFTLDPTDVDAKRGFLTEIGVALRDRGRWALFAMREDFIAQLDPYLGLLPTRLTSRYRLDLLDPAAAELAAQRPAADLGVAFSDAAADRLVDDLRRVRVQRGALAAEELGPNVEPVQLQVVCRQLWNTLDPAATSIALDDVVALGNVDDALADFYVDQIVTVAGRTGVSEREIRTWFDEQLISADGFRTQVLEGPGAAGPAVLRELENAHLIRADRRRGTEWYELSHDRLVAPVRASNARWREEHLNPLQREAQIWDTRSRPQGLLITGEVLTEAEEWARTHEDELLPVDREYLEASRAEQRRVDLERKVSRRNRVLAVAATAVGVLAVVGLVLANSLRATAARERDRAQNALSAQRSAEAAQKHLNDSNAWLAAGAQADQPRLQLLSWLAAFKANPENESADLARKLTTAQHYLVHDPIYIARARALDPTGTKIARGTADGRVEIVDVATLQREVVADVKQPVEAVAFSPTDGALAVAAGGSVSFWQGATSSGELTAPELSGGHEVRDLSLADGRDGLVAAVVLDTATGPYGRLLVWDKGAQIVAPVAGDVPVARAVLTRDRLAVIAEDPDRPDGLGILRVWQHTTAGWQEAVVDPDLVPPARPTLEPYAALAFSADGAHLAAGTVEGLKVYSLLGPGGASPSQPADVDGDAPTIVGAAFRTATPDTVRAIDKFGNVVEWQLTASGEWQVHDLSELVPTVDAQMDADGGRVLLGNGSSFTVADTAVGTSLVGQLAVSRGSTSRGRSVVVQRSGAVDEQASPGAPWSRGPGSGTVDAALSPDSQLLARLVRPSGNVQITSPSGTGAEQSMCPDAAPAVAAQVADRTNEDALALAVADNAVVAATADPPLRADDVNPTAAGRSSWCVLPTDAGAFGHESLVGEQFGAVGVSADGQRFVVGTELNGAGTVDVYPVETGELETTQTMTSAVTAVALTSDIAPLVAAGDAQGNVVAFQLGSADAEGGFGSEIRCDVALPVTQPVTAVSVGKSADGDYLAAAATRKGVFVYRIAIVSDSCATLIGGFDLQRDEGEVIDLAFDEEGRLTALESDLNVFTFDPLIPRAELADSVTQLSDERGWVLTQDDCEVLPRTPECST